MEEQEHKIKEEEQFAMMITGGVHVVLVIFFILYSFSLDANVRPSFIEVEFGEFQTGTLAEQAEVQNEQVATRPDPSEIEPEDPQPEEPVPEEEQQATSDEVTKPVDAPDQVEEIDAEKVETPDTDKVDPEEETNNNEQEEVAVPPKTQQDVVQQDGAETSGDEQGNEGELNADQGTGNDAEKSSPYELQWDGDIERDPRIQPLPENVADQEATITIRFEVRPDGRVGQVVPLRKMNPELEREVLRTFREWRFSQLPSGVPQQSQWGVITFRFVIE